MDKEWDYEENLLTEEAKAKKRIRDWEETQLRITEGRERNRREREYFTIPNIPDNDIRSSFPHFGDVASVPGIAIARWGANKSVYICHNCGCFGYKLYGECHELFKCYGCHSRNLLLIRAGDISLALRNTAIGVNMQDVYRRRRERLRRNRS